MIKLDIRDYCQSCPNFEAETRKCYDANREPGFIILCMHHELCMNIHQYLEEKNWTKDIRRGCETCNHYIPGADLNYCKDCRSKHTPNYPLPHWAPKNKPDEIILYGDREDPDERTTD